MVLYSESDLLVEGDLCNWILGDTLQDRIGVNNSAGCLQRTNSRLRALVGDCSRTLQDTTRQRETHS